mmetsp:Transcript_42490/g.90752  ORF Transcript_42490/g.90752 Transcript_42490/m.90752 type:complete len:251 (-) Transcript_42490:575-1327(-)
MGERTRLDALLGVRQAEAREEPVGDTLEVEEERHSVDVRDVVHADAVLGRHVAEERQLVLRRARERLGGAADEEVGHEADGAQILHRMLRGLRLLLAHNADHRHERYVHEAHVVATDAELKLPERFDEGHGLDVTDCAAQLDDADIRRAGLVIRRDVRNTLDPFHDRVSHVRHNLHGLTEVVASALPLQALLVHLSRRDVVVAPKCDPNETLVVSQIEVHLAAVVKSENLAVLKGRHGARVDVEVRIDLH